MGKIVGNTVGVPNPQSDWNQIDSAKADFIKNKPDINTMVDNKIADLVNSAPEALDTLNELAAALGDDPEFSATVLNKISGIEGQLENKVQVIKIPGALDVNTAFDDYIQSGIYVFLVSDDDLGSYSSLAYILQVSTYSYGNEVYQTLTDWLGNIKHRDIFLYSMQPPYAWTDYDGIVSLNGKVKNKADKSTTLAGYGITDAYTKTESDAKHETLQNQIYNVSDTANFAYNLADDIDGEVAVLKDTKEDKTVIEYWGTADGDISLIHCNNSEIRYHSTPNALNFILADGEYDSIYMTSVSFATYNTPPQISYTNSGIINWVGTDCSLDNDGYSLFIPSANVRYEIIIYFNGVHFVGLVNGYKSAIGNKGTAEAVSE